MCLGRDSVIVLSQAAHNQLKDGYVLVGIGDIHVTNKMPHQELLNLVIGQTGSYELRFTIPAEIPEHVVSAPKSIEITEDGGRIGILTEGQNDKIVIVNLVVHGQGHKQGCELNDVVVGMDDVPLDQLMHNTCSCKELNDLIAHTARPFTVNLNSIPNPQHKKKTNQYVPSVAMQIGPPIDQGAGKHINQSPQENQENKNTANISNNPPGAKKPHPLSKIAGMVRKGIEVKKIHNNPSMFNDSCGNRVIWMDDKLTTLYCAQEKGYHTSKRFPLLSIVEIKNLGNKPGKEHRFAIVHQTGILTLEVSSTKARDAVASNMQRLVEDRQNTMQQAQCNNKPSRIMALQQSGHQ